MNKKIISSVIFVSLFCLVGFALAQGVTITNPLSGTDTIAQLLTKIVAKAGEVIAALGTIMIIVAGILYLTSAGSPERMGTAKKALVYAIIGIAIGLTASTIAKIICETIGTTC